MSEIHIWMTTKDNPHLSEQEIAAQNAEWDRTINAETSAKIVREMERDEKAAVNNHEDWWNNDAI